MNLKAVWHDLEYRAYSDSSSIIQRGLGDVPAADDVRFPRRALEQLA
jgi:hypothetical protein